LATAANTTRCVGASARVGPSLGSLLLEADATLELCELQPLAVMRDVNPARLSQLSDLMG
jgi:hypothetical protein